MRSQSLKTFECHFATVKPIDDLLNVFQRVFGKNLAHSDCSLPYGFENLRGHFFWREHMLDVAFFGEKDGPYLVHTTTSNKDALKVLKQIRNAYEMNPAKIFRRALLRCVKREYLDELDRRIEFGIIMLSFISVFWLALGLPNEVRVELLLVSASIGVIHRYGRMVNAVDIRLMLWSAFWYFTLVGIPCGILYGVAMTIVVFFPNSFIPLGISNLLPSMVAMFIMMLAFFLALARGGIAKKRSEGQWKYLTPKPVPAVLTIGLQYIETQSQGVLMFLMLLSGLSFGVWNLQILPEPYGVVCIGAMLAFVPFFLYSARNLSRCMKGVMFRNQIPYLAKDLPEFAEIVAELGEEEDRRRRYKA